MGFWLFSVVVKNVLYSVVITYNKPFESNMHHCDKASWECQVAYLEITSCHCIDQRHFLKWNDYFC